LFRALTGVLFFQLGPSTPDPLNASSLLRPLASLVIGTLLWLSAATGAPTVRAGEAAISEVSASTLALPSVPVRLAKVSTAASRTQVAREVGQWLAPFPMRAAAPEFGVRCSTTPPSGNGRASRDVLALTFPYYATAPPALRV
jgi:hypothetical protein